MAMKKLIILATLATLAACGQQEAPKPPPAPPVATAPATQQAPAPVIINQQPAADNGAALWGIGGFLLGQHLASGSRAAPPPPAPVVINRNVTVKQTIVRPAARTFNSGSRKK